MPYDYLENLESTYAASAAATGGRVPNGRYLAILNEARLHAPTAEKPVPRFSCSFVIMEGPYAGRFLYLDWRFDEKGFPHFKRFVGQVSVDLPRLVELPDRLAEFRGKICQLSVTDDKNNPQYQRTYLDRCIGTGDPADYLKDRPAPAGMASESTLDLVPVDDEDGDLPF